MNIYVYDLMIYDEDKSDDQEYDLHNDDDDRDYGDDDNDWIMTIVIMILT